MHKKASKEISTFMVIKNLNKPQNKARCRSNHTYQGRSSAVSVCVEVSGINRSVPISVLYKLV